MEISILHGAQRQPRKARNHDGVEQTLGRGARVIATRLRTGGSRDGGGTTVVAIGPGPLVLRRGRTTTNIRTGSCARSRRSRGPYRRFERSDPAPHMVAPPATWRRRPCPAHDGVPERVPDAARPEHWLREMEQMLASIHALDARRRIRVVARGGQADAAGGASRATFGRGVCRSRAAKGTRTCSSIETISTSTLLWSREGSPA